MLAVKNAVDLLLSWQNILYCKQILFAFFVILIVNCFRFRKFHKLTKIVLVRINWQLYI